jgi:hypothetical protein
VFTKIVDIEPSDLLREVANHMYDYKIKPNLYIGDDEEKWFKKNKNAQAKSAAMAVWAIMLAKQTKFADKAGIETTALLLLGVEAYKRFGFSKENQIKWLKSIFN